MSIRALEQLVADRLDGFLLRKDAMRAQGADQAEKHWNEIMYYETNGLCLALTAVYAEQGVTDPDHFPRVNFLSEEWRAQHRSKI